MRLVYNTALLPLGAAAVVWGAWPRTSATARLERDQRLGRRLPSVPSGAVWLHGASVGEARLVASIARAWRSRAPRLPLVVSAVTPAGRAVLPAPPDADASFFLPLDFAAVQRRAFDAIRPTLVVLLETELWPNLLWEGQQRGIPVALVNARLAPERWRRYRRLRSLYGPLVRSLAAVLCASATEAERFAGLGALPARLSVTGNLKYDLPAPDTDAGTLSARFGLDPGQSVVVAGSTGAGEDTILLDALVAARREIADLFLVLAPRHLERAAEAASDATRRGLRVHRLSSGADRDAGGADVLVADRIGELSGLYALGAGSFVGGSLVPVGGHNLLEPIAAGSPPLFGPHTGHVAEIAEALLAAGAAERVGDGGALARAWIRLAREPDERAKRVRAGRKFLDANRGALDRTLSALSALLDPAPRGRAAVSP